MGLGLGLCMELDRLRCKGMKLRVALGMELCMGMGIG